MNTLLLINPTNIKYNAFLHFCLGTVLYNLYVKNVDGAMHYMHSHKYDTTSAKKIHLI